MQNLSYENEFDLRWWNTFSYKLFRNRTRFETEAKANLEMAFWIKSLCGTSYFLTRESENPETTDHSFTDGASP